MVIDKVADAVEKAQWLRAGTANPDVNPIPVISRRMAVAAIEALREIPDSVILAGMEHDWPHLSGARAGWNAMIDEILKREVMPYTVKEKLQQLIDTPVGADMPAFFSEGKTEDVSWNWVTPLKQMAREALAEIAKLEEKAWMYDDLCK